MTDRPAYNALKDQGPSEYVPPAPAPPRYVKDRTNNQYITANEGREEATDDDEMENLVEDALGEASKQREEDMGR